MQNTTVSRIPFFSLLGNLREELKRLISEEIKLAKAELGEKVSFFGKNAIVLAVGGLVWFLVPGLIVWLSPVLLGLVLAVPITAGIKAVCDNVSSLQGYGKLLGD